VAYVNLKELLAAIHILSFGFGDWVLIIGSILSDTSISQAQIGVNGVGCEF
jgi:hypothetical protein